MLLQVCSLYHAINDGRWAEALIGKERIEKVTMPFFKNKIFIRCSYNFSFLVSDYGLLHLPSSNFMEFCQLLLRQTTDGKKP